MTTSESKDGLTIPYSAFTIVAMILATVVLKTAPLDSARLASEAPGRSSEVWLQNIQTDLWQDPYAAVEKYRSERRNSAVEALARDLREGMRARPPAAAPDHEHLFENLVSYAIQRFGCEAGKRVRIVAPLVYGGATEEEAELRRRVRYATVSALIKAGFVPDNPGHIGYAYVRDELRTQRIPPVMPFEWYIRPGDAPHSDEALLILWLDHSYFHQAPIERLRRIQELASAGEQCELLPKMQVLGPLDSTYFSVFLSALQRGETGSAYNVGGLDIVSSNATAAVSTGETNPLQVRDVTLYRLTGTDDGLIRLLADELQLRRPFAPMRIAVVSELDTDYGRAFIDHARQYKTKQPYHLPPIQDDARMEPMLPESAWAGTGTPDVRPDRFESIKAFGYLRRLDGGGAPVRKSTAKEDKTGGSDATQANRAHGAAQLDYLRRLADEIRVAVGGEPDAIGIFGNDVYDKLLILRALRAAFPKSLFMTTDVDARLLDEAESPFAKNLIVASSYGVSLDPVLQQQAAFRDAYQTATHFAALLVAGDCVDAAFNGPDRHFDRGLLYEQGRTGLIPLDPPPPTRLSFASCAPGTTKHFVGLQSAHPIRSPEKAAVLPARHLTLLLAALATAIVVGCYAVRPRPRLLPAHTPPSIGARLTRMADECPLPVLGGLVFAVIAVTIVHWPAAMARGAAVFLGFAIGLGFCYCLLHALGAGNAPSHLASRLFLGATAALLAVTLTAALVPNAEPFQWAEGVSAWPSQLIRWGAAVFAIFALLWIHRIERGNAATIRRRYGLGRRPHDGDDVRRLWNRYLAGKARRNVASLAWSLLYLVSGSTIIALVGSMPGVPARGAHNIFVIQILIGFVVYLSIALVVNLLLSYRAVVAELLTPAQTGALRFPCGPRLAAALRLTPDSCASPLGRSFLDLYLVHRLAADRLATLATIIYFPFAVSTFIVIARSPVFDGWDTPPGLLMLLVLPFVALLASVVWLHRRTVEFHECIVGQMREELIRLRAGIDDHQLWQLQTLLTQVEQEKRGSFQSVATQPFIRALLLPVGGFSGIELLEHLVLR